ncbi:PhaM family polyhydroxyalkanoate granule multifunctional regulatory protein [Diaphorobacter aerolatus]|uniref:PhaM family polyhydroxyalkanoate granule multifunctional regulatory protein n=1 Tax=Diaphorobacter aerolatus TaxID=1288495 RepID=UPI00299F56EB|nr:PhaM family polyhydroxyalkanoate granule multifunctional regulatory protein [Diaphorobacter aerolatus]
MSDSDNTPFGFGRFVPGFDFLQNLAKGAATGVSSMPGLASWVAPTVSVEELEKRINELKSVQFWLEQNSRALAATVQALEVQKMTLATLENMNVAMGDFAGAFGAQMAGAAGPGNASRSTQPKAAKSAEPPARPAAVHEQEPREEAADTGADAEATSAIPAAAAFMPGAAGMVDPVQWWSSLTNQFQQIAANAMRDVSQHAASAPAINPAAGQALRRMHSRQRPTWHRNLPSAA